MWLVRSEDIADLEAKYCALLRAETPDPSFLHTAAWIGFRGRLIRFLDERDADAVRTHDSLPMAGHIRLVVLGAHAEHECVLEAELFHVLP